jgi:hypothetical protein
LNQRDIKGEAEQDGTPYLPDHQRTDEREDCSNSDGVWD